MDYKIVIEVDQAQLDSALEKASQLAQILEKADVLINSYSDKSEDKTFEDLANRYNEDINNFITVEAMKLFYSADNDMIAIEALKLLMNTAQLS